MVDDSTVNRRYSYIRECKWPVEAIDLHHVVVRRSRVNRFFGRLSVLVKLSYFLVSVAMELNVDAKFLGNCKSKVEKYILAAGPRHQSSTSWTSKTQNSKPTAQSNTRGRSVDVVPPRV
ncbi:hypothetical protein Q3G72_024587 [Acer saccharum]|nr:hypothetical protein Q3G72_024587 [Acer saccharum]